MNLFYIGIIVLIIFLSLFLYMNTFKPNTSNKVVIFDMDETLGHFVDIGSIWYGLKQINHNLTKTDFFQLLDLYPEYIRPQIFEILEYLKKMKNQSKIDRVIIFTNNNGPKSWSLTIKDYFNYKLGENLIDQVVAAYKIGNKQIEPYRTSHYKKYTDIIKACGLNKNTKICFLDDQKHPRMLHKNVYYLLIQGYNPKISKQEIFTRLMKSPLHRLLQSQKNKNTLLFYMNYLKDSQYNLNSFTQAFKEKGQNIHKNIHIFVEKF